MSPTVERRYFQERRPEASLPPEPQSLELLMWRANSDSEIPEAIELSDDMVAWLLLNELQRPPWYREIDAERKAFAKETA